MRLRGTKEGQECASVGDLETFSMSSGERQGKNKRGKRCTREAEQEHMRGTKGGHIRCTAEVHEMNNRGTIEALHRTENT